MCVWLTEMVREMYTHPPNTHMQGMIDLNEHSTPHIT